MFSDNDIAKEANDIIIIDNNFTSILTVNIYRRNIYNNIGNFLQFQFSTDFSDCIIVFICAYIGVKYPLCFIQILWINLI